MNVTYVILHGERLAQKQLEGESPDQKAGNAQGRAEKATPLIFEHLRRRRQDQHSRKQ